jgi:hypothetical protein
VVHPHLNAKLKVIKMRALRILMVTVISTTAAVLSGHCQAVHPKSSTHPVQNSASSEPVGQGPTFQETADFIRAKLRLLSGPATVCGNGYELNQSFIAGNSDSKPNKTFIWVTIHPVFGDPNQSCVSEWTSPREHEYVGTLDLARIAIGSIVIEKTSLAKIGPSERPVVDLWNLSIPFSGPDPNFREIKGEGLGREVTNPSQFHLYLGDQDTAERVKKALIALAKMCGAKDEAY